jgi:serine/threonine-protein kinase
MSEEAPIAGKYRLLRRIGGGAMGEVWAALHVEMRREVALKLIHENSPELGMRLTREGQALGRLEHQNIVRVYDIGATDSGDPFLVMELLSGETLADRLARVVRLPQEDAVGIALQIALALRAAHEAAVVHRDLKPANVFLHRSAIGETVKVLDFGVSKLLALDMAFTATGALIGSPAYMSPEAARALKDIDPRADLWSLGVLLFEMVAGARPFVSPTVVGIVAEILSAPIPRLSSVVPSVDPRLDELVARCLVRDVDRRVASADEVIDALAAIATAPAPSAAEAPAPVDDPPTPVASEAVATAVFDPATIPRAPRPPVVADPDPEPDSNRPTTLLKGKEAMAVKTRAAAAIGASKASRPFPRVPRVHEVDPDEDATIVKSTDAALEEDAPTTVQVGPWNRRDLVAQTVRLPESFTPPAASPRAAPKVAETADVITVPLPVPVAPPLPEPADLARRERLRVIVLTSAAAFAITLVLVLAIALLR